MQELQCLETLWFCHISQFFAFFETAKIFSKTPFQICSKKSEARHQNAGEMILKEYYSTGMIQLKSEILGNAERRPMSIFGLLGLRRWKFDNDISLIFLEALMCHNVNFLIKMSTSKA